MSPLLWEAVPGLDAHTRSTGFAALLRRDATFRRALAGIDVIAICLSVLAAVFVVDPGRVEIRWPLVLLLPFVVLTSKAIGLYDRDQYLVRKTTIDEAPHLLHAAVFVALAVWLAEDILFRGWLARPQVFALAVADFVLLVAGRSMIRRATLAMTPSERCVVLGSDTDSGRVADKLAQSSGVKVDVVGRVALHTDDLHRGSEALLGPMASLERIVDQHAVERVIIAPGSHNEDEVLHAIRLVKALGVKVSVLPRLLEVVGSSSTFDDVDGMTLLGVRQYGLTKSSALLKRLLDIAAASAGLLVLTPLMAMLAFAVKVGSRGPVFFRQPRIGRGGELFNMLKFRSMIPDAEAAKQQLVAQNEAQGGLFKISDDPRITSVGRFLRRTSLDELPQLFNVLLGSMSLVGPRPLVPDEDARIEGWKRRRLAVKPGMTGLWQVFGSSRIPMNEMVKIDYIYGANWSIWLDLKILLRTIPYVLRRRGM